MSTIIDIDVLVELVGGALAATVVVSIAFATAIYGASSFADARRDGRRLAAGAFVAVTAVSLTVFGGGVTFAISIITTK